MLLHIVVMDASKFSRDTGAYQNHLVLVVVRNGFSTHPSLSWLPLAPHKAVPMESGEAIHFAFCSKINRIINSI